MRDETRNEQRTEKFCKINAQCEDEYGCIPCDDGYDCEYLRRREGYE